MTKDEKRAAQAELNAWTKRWLRGVTPLIVDGDFGPSTQRRIKWVKFYLGYGASAGKNDAKWTSKFVRSLRHPKTPRSDGLNAQQIKVGTRRRATQKARAKRHEETSTPGVVLYDGVPCAKWLADKLDKARGAGRWKGKLVSGYRSPAYSESLCVRMCGAPRCPGRCAGRSSNHAGKDYPRGAVDVTDYVTFEAECARLNLGIKNTLDARDPVHFSVPGN